MVYICIVSIKLHGHFMIYLHRVLESQVKQHLKFFPVVGITGPRQSGKSTLLQHLLVDYRYVTFDDHEVLMFFYNDPKKFMRVYNNKVIFDEVQNVPEIFNAIKLAVDCDRDNYGKFVLIGSSQFAFLKKVSESLAGRIALLSLLPLQYSEMPEALREECIFRGGYPELVDRAYQLSGSWYSSYMDTYLNKDLRKISHIDQIRDFQRLIELLAANTSQILNMSHYARKIGVTVKTIKEWISVLEASYIIFLLPPFYNNLGKRIIKSPKVYFYDTGLVSYLTGIKTKELFEKGPMSGSLFENYIVSEIMKKNLHQKSDANLYFYRTSRGLEIDLIVDYKTHKEWIEIKAGETYRQASLEPMENLMEPKDTSYLLYRGAPVPYLDNIKVINYQEYLDR